MTFVNGLRRFFRWPRQPSNTALVTDDDTPSGRIDRQNATRVRIFLAPGTTKEPLGDAMRGWLTSLLSTLRQPVTEVLLSEAASADAVRALLKQHRSNPILLVFYGHGTPEGLVCRATPSSEPAHDPDICTADDFHDEMDVQMIAFCCSAGLGLGQSLRRLKSSAMLGFRDEIGFVLGKPERERAFSVAIETAVLEACDTNQIDELTLLNLSQAYQAEQARWMPGGERANDTRAMLIAMFLHQHRRLLQLV